MISISLTLVTILPSPNSIICEANMNNTNTLKLNHTNSWTGSEFQTYQKHLLESMTLIITILFFVFLTIFVIYCIYKSFWKIKSNIHFLDEEDGDRGKRKRSDSSRSENREENKESKHRRDKSINLELESQNSLENNIVDTQSRFVFNENNDKSIDSARVIRAFDLI